MPHLTTRPCMHQEANGSLTSLVSRWSLLVALCLPLNACSKDETDKDDESEKSEEDGSEQEDGSEDKDGSDDDASEDDESEGDGSEGDGSEDDDEDVDKDDDQDDDKDDDKNDDKDDDKDSSSSSGGSEEESDSGTGGSDGGDDTGEAKERDCSNIEWGSKLKEGTIVPQSTNQGYMDTDGDHNTESEETEVGMCTLHETGAKCALVISGFLG